MFTATDNGLYTVGGECYMIDSLSNNVFLGKDKRILYDAAYPEETMRNMLMGAVNPAYVNMITLDITPHTYNKEIQKFSIPMSRFIGYLQKQGFRFYTGTLGRNGDKCQCLLAMFHPVYNYLHILSVSYLPSQLESSVQVTIKADLSTFIPQHNIKNLFQEK